MSYHISNLGSLASRALVADIEGYVHLTAADEIAALNRRATDASTDKDPDQ